MFNGKKALFMVSAMTLATNFVSAELSSKAKRAEKLAATGKTVEAMEIYKELMGKSPQKEPALVKEGKEGMAALLLVQAKESFDAGSFSDAKVKAQNILADYENTPSINEAAKVMVMSQLELSKRLIESKKYEDCISQSKDVKSKIPAGNDALAMEIDKGLSKLSGDLLAAAEENIKLEKFEPAQKLLETAAASSVEKTHSAKCRYTLGKCFRLSNQFDKAIEAYQDVTTNFSDTPFAASAHADLFLVYQRLESRQDALDSIKQAVQLVPENSDYLFKEAQAYQALGKTEEAQKDAAKVIDLLQAEIPKTYINKENLQYKMGQAHLILGQDTEAAVEFDKALARNPNMLEARKGLAQAQFSDKNFSSAIGTYDALIKTFTNEFNDANDKLSKEKTSDERAKRVEDLRKDIAYFHFQKGLSYEQLGEFDKALAECRIGLEGVSTQEAAATQKRIQLAQEAAQKKAEPVAPAPPEPAAAQ
ncbi:MAG: tetratricopeptide repeat protein [Elusimicrobia bacterium]|nr:tetratricopeptide repeat protein [Elusimicrobiota bacterium]